MVHEWRGHCPEMKTVPCDDAEDSSLKDDLRVESAQSRQIVSAYTRTDLRIGLWSASSVAVLGAIYVVTGGIGIVARPPSPELLRQVDPFLAILEVLIMLSAVAQSAMIAAVHAYAPPDKKTYSLVSFALMIGFAAVTCSVHFASLTVGRQIDTHEMPQLAQQFRFDTWPTIALALDLLAWDFFFGLSLLFATPVFRGDSRHTRVRIAMLVSGTLCLAGTLGPLVGHMRIQFLAITGYAFVFPLACVFLAMLFIQELAELEHPSATRLAAHSQT